MEYDLAFLLEALVEDETMARPAQQVREQFLSVFDWLAPQVSTVEFKQIERAMFGIGDCVVAAEQVKDGKPVLIANDSFAVDQARTHRQVADRYGDKGKPRREIIAVASNEPHSPSIAAR